MTVRGRYNESMKNCLLSAAASGAFWLILLFVVSFLAVHTVRLAKIGWNYQKRHVTPPEKSSAEKRGSEPARRDRPRRRPPKRPRRKSLPNPSIISWSAKNAVLGKPIPRRKKSNSNKQPRLCRQRQRRGITKLFLLPRLSVASVLYPSAHKPRYIFGRPQNARYFSSGAASSYFSRLPPSSHSRSR